jgi:hypothetical protein
MMLLTGGEIHGGAWAGSTRLVQLGKGTLEELVFSAIARRHVQRFADSRQRVRIVAEYLL